MMSPSSILRLQRELASLPLKADVSQAFQIISQFSLFAKSWSKKGSGEAVAHKNTSPKALAVVF